MGGRLWLALLVVSFALPARADNDGQDDPAAIPREPPTNDGLVGSDLSLGGFAGGFGAWGTGGAMLGSLTGLGRLGIFEGGGLLQLGEAFSPPGAFWSAALLAGIGFQSGGVREGGPRVEVLGELGIDSFPDAVGGPHDAGAGGSVRVYGVRFGASYRFAAHRYGPRGGVGLWLALEQDESKALDFYSCRGLLDCDLLTTDVGGSRVAVLVGGTADFFAH